MIVQVKSFSTINPLHLLVAPILKHPKPHIHVKNPLFGNISTRLKLPGVLLFEFRRHLWKASMLGANESDEAINDSRFDSKI